MHRRKLDVYDPHSVKLQLDRINLLGERIKLWTIDREVENWAAEIVTLSTWEEPQR